MKRFLFLIMVGSLSLLNQGYAFFGNYGGCDCRGFQGLYVGGNLGWVAWDHNWLDRSGWFDDNFGSYTSTSHDFTAGAQIGYNYQCGCALFGIETDGNWIDLKRTKHAAAYTLDDSGGVFEAFDLTIRDRLDWFGTIRGRAGIVANNLLLFATAGACWANFKNVLTQVDDTFFILPETFTERYSTKKTSWGLALGFGAEWMLSSAISIKAEGLFLKFPEFHTNRASILLLPPDNDAFFDFQNTIWIARAGINFNLSSFWP